jgi:ABC-type transport system involved in multi-copper enzyme maturation permease subunit
MRAILTIAQETILLLRRDFIFLPLVLLTIGVVLFAKTASLWSIYEQHKFLYDICFATLHLCGSLATIYWSTKLFSDSRQDGSLEMLLSAPIRRWTVLLGRYLGLAFILAIYCMTSALFIQFVTRYFFGYAWFNSRELLAILFYFEAWLVVAALGTMFASMGGQTTALFSTSLLWFIGLTSSGFALAIDNEQAVAREVAQMIARVWNLQNFNLGSYVGLETFPSAHDLVVRLLYGISIILITLTIGCIAFQKKDTTV